MTLTIDLEDFLSVLERRAFFLDFHAVATSLGTFDVELDIAIGFVTLDYGSYVDTFLATDDAPVVEFGEIKLVHLDRLPRSHNWTWYPHRAAVMSPMVESISDWSLTTLEKGLISLQEAAIVLWNAVVSLLVLVKVEFKYVFLVLEQFLSFSELWDHLGWNSFLLSSLDVVQCLQVLIHDRPFVQHLPLDQLLEANIVLVSLRSLSFVYLVRKLVRGCDTRTLISIIVDILILLVDLVLILLVLLCLLAYFLNVVLAGLFSDGFDLLVVILLVATEDVCGLHRTTSLRTQEALNHLSSLEAENSTIVALPIGFWDHFKPETRLVHRHGACHTKDYLIIIFVVSNAANGTAGVILSNLGALLQIQLLDPILKLFPLCNGSLILNSIQLVHDLAVSDLVSALLR